VIKSQRTLVALMKGEVPTVYVFAQMTVLTSAEKPSRKKIDTYFQMVWKKHK